MTRIDYFCSLCGKLVIDSEEQTEIDFKWLMEKLREKNIPFEEFHKVQIKVSLLGQRACYQCLLELTEKERES